MLDLNAFNMIKSGAETNTRIFTPQKIVKEMLEALPPEVWNSKTTFLDPAVKSGVYLVEIYNKLMEVLANEDDFKDEAVRREHILQKQLFGIAIDEFDSMIAQRNLYGFINPTGNIRTIEKYMDMVKNKDSKFYTDAVKKEFNNMKFDVVIGNPPYQDENGRGLYHRFIKKAMDINANTVSFIVMSSWFNAKSGELCEVKDLLIKGDHLRTINDYIVASDIFPNVTIKGGVSSFIWDRQYFGNCKLVQHNRNLIEKSETTFSKYGYIIRWAKIIPIIDKLCSTGFKRINILTNAFGVDFDDCSIVGTGIKVVNKVESIRYSEESGYTDKENISDNYNLLNKYKVIIGSSLGNAGKTQTDGGTKVLGTLGILNPNEICTNTYMIAFESDSVEVANNALSYFKTKFVRALILATTGGISLGNDNFKFVPIQDFSHPWTDEMLYKKYNLTDGEIAYIESTIKPM